MRACWVGPSRGVTFVAEMQYQVHREINVVELAPVGEVHVKEILAYGHELVDRGLMREGTIEYVDMSAMTNLVVDYASAQLLSRMHDRWLEAGWFGSVYFTPKDLQFGIVRMVSAIVEGIPGAPSGIMVPLREQTPLDQLRAVVQRHAGPPLSAP